ncbi:MAG: HD-GYP domain-containing protein [Methylophagaceae bacterium]
MASIKYKDIINEHNISYTAGRRLMTVPDLNKHVVIVDDESTGRMIMGKILHQVMDNIVLHEFEHPADVLEWLDSNHPDLIVTDYRMPDINGIDFIKKIRLREGCQDIPIMMITVADEKTVRYNALEAGATAFLTRPIDHIECRTSCRNLLKLSEQHSIIQKRAEWLAEQVELATKQIVSREQETLLCLAKAGEYRDEETGNHVIRMAKYSRQIAEELGMSDEECDFLEYAAPMHDIGKIGIPDGILLKPGKLNPPEWEIMQQHAEIGHDILVDSQSKYMQMGAVIALTHHEKFDGSGYPKGLKGLTIPLIGRIVAVADVYDALISARPYKMAWPVEEALDYLKQQSGKHFDPECIDAFFKRLETIRNIEIEYADNPDS